MIPEAAIKAAESAYYETLTELRLAEGGGFKVSSQVKRSLRAALEAAAPYIEPTIKPRDIYRIQAAAIREAFHEFPLETIHAPDHAAVWLSRRADELDRKAERA